MLRKSNVNQANSSEKYSGPERRNLSRRPVLELLEPRTMMTANMADGLDLSNLLSHGGACSCSICTGKGLDQISSYLSASGVSGGTVAAGTAKSALTELPQMSSNSGAKAKLYLDFNGNFEAKWGSYSNVTTKVYDIDGDFTTFSSQELLNIREIWARVAEDYAPFNIDVTTVDPGSNTDGVVARIAIGGNYSDWFGQSAGGVAYVGGFKNSAPNVGFAFSDALGHGTPRYVAEAASHEAGHLFGLSHQSTWNGSTLVANYSSGDANWAPIMGVGYYSARTTWHNGATDAGPTAFQDDVAIVGGSYNGFGFRADDFGNTIATASNMVVNNGSASFNGLINTSDDLDMLRFSTAGGAVSFKVDVSQYGPNLDSILEVRDLQGSVIASANPTDSFGATLSTTLGAGTYVLVVRSSGGYGNMGQYVVTGSGLTTTSGGNNNTGGGTTAAAKISVSVAGIGAIASGSTINFGSTAVGTPVDRTITLKNTGNATLNLSSFTVNGSASGFTLVPISGSKTSLAAGESASFILRMTASAAGSPSGNVTIGSNDPNLGSFNVKLAGTVTAPLVRRMLDDGGQGYGSTGKWTAVTGRGREGDIHVAAKGTQTAAAVWEFSSLPNGQYKVFANWTGGKEFATNAPFVISGGQSSTTVRVNQQTASSGYSAEGTNWTLLGTVTVTSGKMYVTLSNVGANGHIQADSIRIEQQAASTGNASGGSKSLTMEESGSDSSMNTLVLTSSSSQTHTSTPEAPQRTPSGAPAGQTSSARQDFVFSQAADVHVENQLLDETMSLLSEAQKGSKGSSGSSHASLSLDLHDSLFAGSGNW